MYRSVPARLPILSFALLGLLAGCRRDNDEALVSVEIPRDPHAPVIMDLAIGGVVHPLIVDTGATDIVLDLAIAQRLLKPLPETAGQPPIDAAGLHGAVRLHRFATGRRVELQDWRFDTDGTVFATDISGIRQEIRAHGVVGTLALSQLNWIWDNRNGRLRGFEHGSPQFNAERSPLHCVEMQAYDGVPGVQIEVAGSRGAFLLDTGDLLASGGLAVQDRDVLAAGGAIENTALSGQAYRDVADAELGPMQMSQIRNVSLGPLRLDGLVMHSQHAPSRLSRGFFSKFDRVALDFQQSKFCFPKNASIAADSLADYR